MFSSHGRYFIVLIALVLSQGLFAQKVYYPQHSSDLLKATAFDLAELLSKAHSDVLYKAEVYASSAIPTSGIVLQYDSTIAGNQTCRIESDGSGYLVFRAFQDNGLNFGVYAYLSDLGFRFYLPGSIWETIPSILSPYKAMSKTVSGNYKYKSWFISGGYNLWAMDNDQSYGWDTYPGKNGHSWSLYQRRNLMAGQYRFAGHRGDVLTSNYLALLQANPCLIASHNGERIANTRSVPDINNLSAKDLWTNTIREQFSSYKNIITANPDIHSNLYRNFEFNNGIIGIEVPDGAAWGNSTSAGCTQGNWNGKPYPSVSDQQFLLANHSANKIRSTLGDKRFQVYAYDTHANTPGNNIQIDPSIDVQVVPAAFQLESSMKGLLNRWYNRHSSVSEYHYLNIPQWTGETPMTSHDEFAQTISRIKDKHAQGIVIEASPAKFSSLPYLFAANKFLTEGKQFDSSISAFVREMFPGNTGTYVSQLLTLWGNDLVFTVGDFVKDNKHKLPLYLEIMEKISLAANTGNTPAIVKSRVLELKAYLHYMVLYFDFIADGTTYSNKLAKAKAICNYLAKVSNMQLVNSYFLIQDILYKYPVGSAIWQEYDLQYGTAYQSLLQSKITDTDIENNFNNDLGNYRHLMQAYKFSSVNEVLQEMKRCNIEPLAQINVKIAYTNGMDYANRTEFFIAAPSAGSFSIKCDAEYGMPGQGFINLVVEDDQNSLSIIKDITITPESNPGIIDISLPSAGIYRLSILSKYKTSNKLQIRTNGNTFFRKGAFYGNRVENYRDDWSSLPRFVYVPSGIQKLYFSVNDACPASAPCFSATEIQSAFSINDNAGNAVNLKTSSSDSSLFYFEVNNSTAGNFWEVNRMREYNLCFANISNIEIYGQKIYCSPVEFTVSVQQQNRECYTKLTAIAKDISKLEWRITDKGKTILLSAKGSVEVALLSVDAVVTLQSGKECFITKKMKDMDAYKNPLSACTSSLNTPQEVSAYPNPSSGVFNFKVGAIATNFQVIELYDNRGQLVKKFENTSRIDISNLPSAIYICILKKGNMESKQKISKM